MDKNTFGKYSDYYDLLYSDKDYPSEVSYIKTKLSLHSPEAVNLLELGFGTGKHATFLAHSGYKVHGIDASTEMISLANHEPGFTCESADIRFARMGRKYDAVLALFHVLNYLPDDQSVMAVFETAKFHLEVGGVLYFDSWNSECVNHLRPETRIKVVSNEKIQVTRIAEPVIISDENIVKVKYTFFILAKETGEISTFSETHTIRHFSTPELRFFGRLNGFHLVSGEEFLTSKPLSLRTWSAFYVFRRVA